MGFFQDKPPVQEKKVKYSDIKKCVMKKEIGEITEECKQKFKEANIEE